jgi:hypothetical protein
MQREGLSWSFGPQERMLWCQRAAEKDGGASNFEAQPLLRERFVPEGQMTIGHQNRCIPFNCHSFSIHKETHASQS